MSAPSALEARRRYAGPALFSYGFRPFFLAAGLWASLGILLWLPQYFGVLTLPTRFGALDWHIHEMLYGYVAAAVAGFLLTAIPNWTGRLPVNGNALALLAALWLAGRLAILFSQWIGAPLAGLIDIAFLVTLAGFAAREIVSGRNWRNLRVLVVVAVLIAGNIVFHVEVALTGTANYGIRIGIGAMIILISLVGGRIVPSFTNNWLTQNNPGRKPITFGRFDMITMAVSAAALLTWIALDGHPVTGALLLIAGLLHAVRLARWAGDRTLGERLVLVLHVAYAFIPVGFLLLGASMFSTELVPSAGIHAWTAGAIGMMTIAVMTRATLGHTGQPLHANILTQVVYACVFLSAVLRICAAVSGETHLLDVSGALWIGGFGLFAIGYWNLLVLNRPAWEAHRC
jgi:uncharacterized protein involved in response to NO